MKNAVFVLLFLFSNHLSAQTEFPGVGYLKLQLQFESVVGMGSRIQGVIKDDNRKYNFYDSTYFKRVVSGVRNIEILINVRSKGAKPFTFRIDDHTVRSGDTSFIALTIPDSVLKAVNYLKELDRKGTFYPDQDGVNYIDDIGRKQGVWIEGCNYIGNCLNYSGTFYRLYIDNEMKYSLSMICDKNFCYRPQPEHALSIRKYLDSGFVQHIRPIGDGKCQGFEDLILPDLT